MIRRRAIMAAATLLSGSGAAYAGTTAIDRPPQPATAVRLDTPLAFDGRLDDPAWRSAPALDQFTEHYPGDRLPAPEQTAVRFLYDDRYLYIGIRAALRDVARLRKPFVRRDKVNASHDYVQVYLDPQGARRSSYLFRVNARGVKTDGLQDEAKLSESTDPDFDWDVVSAIDDGGWSAELRIPLSTLRVSRSGAQIWSVIVTRGVPRDQNTQMATANFTYDSSCFLCRASSLSFADLAPRGERLIVEPSIGATARRDSGVYGRGTSFAVTPSLDAKWLPYGGAAIDLTINPDFSQVEADSPQLTANERFAISLPEKRPFFREGSDLISTALPILYTRTITAPDYGLRFTHRSATINGTSFAARDGGRGPIIEPGLLASSAGLPDFDSDVGFVHVTRGFGAALAGALGSVKLNDDGSYNAVGGVDASWQSKSDRVVGQFAVSKTREPDRPDLLAAWDGQRRDGVAALAQWDHTGSLVWSLAYTRYDPGFRSWLGYVPRVGYQNYHAYLRKPVYRRSRIINTLSPYASFDWLDAIDARGHERDLGLGASIGGLRGFNADVSVHPATIVLDRRGIERATSDVRWTSSITPGPRFPVVSFNGNVGRRVDFATGEVVPGETLSAIVRTRPIDRLELEGRYSRLRLGDAPGGGARLHETVSELIATWYFGPSFYVLADAQFYDTRRTWPTPAHTASSLLSLQFSREAQGGWRSYFGVRSGAVHPELAADRGRSTELYFKLSNRLRL